MTKTNNTHCYKPLIVTGYTLFALLTTAVVLSTTIPLGRMLFSPNVIHLNAAVILLSLTLGAILPALLGYFIGNSSVKSTSNTRHHFNGVLFGLLAYWITMIIAPLALHLVEPLAGSHNLRIILINLIPIIAVAVITIFIGVAHLKSKYAHKDILTYRPYSLLLIGAALLLPIWVTAGSLLSGSMLTFDIYVATTPVTFLLVGIVSHVSLTKSRLDILQTLTWIAISLSVAFVALLIVSQLVSDIANLINPTPTQEFQTATYGISWILALVGWGIFWLSQAKTLVKS